MVVGLGLLLPGLIITAVGEKQRKAIKDKDDVSLILDEQNGLEMKLLSQK